MKHTRLSSLLLGACLCVSAMSGLSSCQDKSIEQYQNNAFVSSSRLGTLLLKGSDELEQTIKTAIARPESTEQSVSYTVGESYLAQYNETYGTTAILLPKDNYEIVNPTSVITSGAVVGTDVVIRFKNLKALDRDQTYLLPISVDKATMPFLASSRVVYYLIKAGALINSVANPTKNYLSLQNPAGAEGLNDMRQLTVEAYVRVDKFGKLISTLMGIENNFLIRIGDANVPDDQIQLATRSGNVTHTDWRVPINKWTHIAVTFNSSDGATDVYIDGVKKGSTQYSQHRTAVGWGYRAFFVGRSYDNNRWFEGDMCELRVWNKVLTPEEINAKNHFYTVEPTSEGLVAYWKFDEATGNVVKDHTANGYHLLSNDKLVWKVVELPKQ